MAIKLKGIPGGITIKTSYDEISTADLLRVEGDSPRDLIAALCGAPTSALLKVASEDIVALYEIARFVEDPNDIAAGLRPGDDIAEPDIPAATWQTVELLRARATDLKSLARLLPELAKIYYGPEGLEGSAALVMARGASVLSGLSSFLERFKDLGGEAPTEAQKEAGIEALHSFGPYAIADQIGEKYGVRPYEVFDWAAEEVYMSLLFSQAKDRYSKNYSDIERRKQPKQK